jgi:hypothetical protein
MAHAEISGAMPGKKRRELAGIQMIGVVRRAAVLGVGNRLGRQALIAQPPLGRHEIAEAAPLPLAQPVRHQVHLREPLRKHQGMIIGVIPGTGGPAGKLSALLEGGVALPEKRGLGYADAFQRRAHGRPGALADTDDLDVRGFNQRDGKGARLDTRLMARGDDARGQPTRRSTAHYYD